MTDVNYSKPLLVFILTVVVMTVLMAVISGLLKVNTFGGSVVVPMVGALFGGQSFVKSYGRVPTTAEAKRLTRLSFFFFMGLQVLFFIFAFANPSLKSLFLNANSAVLIMVAVFLVFYFGIAFVFIRWGYGRLLQKLSGKYIK